MDAHEQVSGVGGRLVGPLDTHSAAAAFNCLCFGGRHERQQGHRACQLGAGIPAAFRAMEGAGNERRPKRASQPKSFRKLTDIDEEIKYVDRFDFNADGIVDNEEYVEGLFGVAEDVEVEVPGAVARDRPADEWTTSDVFATLERSRSLVPEVVPGVFANVMEYAVNPNEPWKKTWNSVVLAAVIFSTFEVPFSSAFRPEGSDLISCDETDSECHAGSDLLIIIDMVFYIDMVLNFFTGALAATVYVACAAAVTLCCVVVLRV